MKAPQQFVPIAVLLIIAMIVCTMVLIAYTPDMQKTADDFQAYTKRPMLEDMK